MRGVNDGGPSSFEFGLAEFISSTATSLLPSFRDIPLSMLLWLEIVFNEGAKEEELQHHLPGIGIPNWKVM